MKPLLADLVCVITGGGQGLGAAIGREMASEGAIVVLLDFTADGLAETAAGNRAAGGQVDAPRLDLTDDDRYAAVVAAITHAAREAGTLSPVRKTARPW